MAVEKGKLLLAINKKFEGKSLSKTFKENLAEKWAAKIDNETDIDDYINDREDVILEASTEADRRATDAVKKLTPPNKEGETKKSEEKVELPSDMPEWAKTLLEQNKTLVEKVNGFETQQTQKTLTERFKSHPELKGIPEFMFKGRIPTTEDEIETAVAELKTDYTAFATENKISILGNDVPNTGGGRNPGEVKEASDDDVKKLLTNITRH